MIDYLILANTRTERDFHLTQDLLVSLYESIYPAGTCFADYRITIVESCADSVFRYPGSCNVVYYDFGKYNEFNYNHALNLGIQSMKSKYDNLDWICVLNNDVVCKSDWLVEISREYDRYPDVESICPNTLNWQPGVIFGYTLFQHLNGCCIMYKACLNDKLSLWDEKFGFYYQDDDYLMTLKTAGVRHMKVLSSMIYHKGSQSDRESFGQNQNIEKLLSAKGLAQFVKKWSVEAVQSYNADKIRFLKQYMKDFRHTRN